MAPAATVLSHSADKGQSIELVRIIIITTFSHILWYRRVFPGMRYIFKTCDPADPATSYNAFVDSPKSGSTTYYEPTDGLTSWAILPRHVNKDADKFLNHLENGVKEALENGSLSKLQLSFHNLGQHPPSIENLIESYTLGFDYKNGISLAEITAEERNSIFGTRTFSVADIKDQMDYMLTEIDHIIINQDRSRRAQKLSLPKSFQMLLTMKYIGAEDYRPVGFHTSGDNLSALIEETPLDLNLMLTTGHHSVIAGMILPGGLPTQENLEVRLDQNVPALLPSKSNEIDRRANRGHSDKASDQIDAETQPQTVAQIGTMGVSRVDDFNTQLIESSLLKSQQASLAMHDEKINATPFTYAQAVLDHVEQMQSHSTHGIDINSQHASQVNTCECQAGISSVKSQQLEARDDTLRCDVCCGLRHPECYGYIGAVQLKVFICYTCLEAKFPEQQTQLRNVQSFCLKRRALNYFLEKGSVMAINDIAIYLNCPRKRASDILSHLRRENYINETFVSKKNRKSFVFNGQKHKAIEQYFNPHTGIEELVSDLLLEQQEAILAVSYRTQLATPHEISIKKHKELQGTILETTTKKLGHSSNLPMRQPRIFHAANHLIITDDTSTQGTPSPHLSYALISDSSTPLTPTGKRDKSMDLAVSAGVKRKADEKSDTKSSKRVMNVVSGTPWSLRRT